MVADVPDTCACCLDALSTDSPLASLACGHAVHAHCLGQLQQNKCPLCRQRIINLSDKEETRTTALCVCLFVACTILPFIVYMLTLLLVSVAGLRIPTYAGLLVALIAMLGTLWLYVRAPPAATRA